MPLPGITGPESNSTGCWGRKDRSEQGRNGIRRITEEAPGADWVIEHLPGAFPAFLQKRRKIEKIIKALPAWTHHEGKDHRGKK